MGKRLLVLLAVAAALGIGAIACSGDDDKGVVRAPSAAYGGTAAAATTTAPPTPSLPPPTPAAPPPAAPAPVSLSVTISNFSFAPNPITVRAGQQLTLNVTNSDSPPHTLAITGGPTTGTLASGAKGTVNFSRPSTGQVQFFCEIHGAARMSGTITVLP